MSVGGHGMERGMPGASFQDREEEPVSAFLLPVRPAQSGQLPLSPAQHRSFLFQERLSVPGMPWLGAFSRQQRIIGASSVKQLWKLAEKCERSELLRHFGQMW